MDSQITVEDLARIRETLDSKDVPTEKRYLVLSTAQRDALQLDLPKIPWVPIPLAQLESGGKRPSPAQHVAKLLARKIDEDVMETLLSGA